MNHSFDIKDLSPHLFWDVDRNTLSMEKNKKYIIHRVLDYGLIDDWKLIRSYYGIKEIAAIAVTIRNLDKRSAVFVSSLSGIPKGKFICFSSTQSTLKHWNF